MSFRRALFCFALCPLLFAFADTVSAGGQDTCDPGLVGNTGSEMAYKLRGDRCEGIYRLEVGGLAVRLESLTEGFKSFDTSDSLPLEIFWSVPSGAGDRGVHLQANALLPRTFYRMDAVVAAETGTFQWPCGLLDRQGYGRDDIGIFGWLEASGTEDEKIYLPLRVVQGGRPDRTGVYELAFSPRRRLEEVYVSVHPSSAAGDPTGPPIWADRALEYGQYLAGNPVFLDLPRLTSGGYYRVEIKVRFLNDGSENYDFVIYHEERSQ